MPDRPEPLPGTAPAPATTPRRSAPQRIAVISASVGAGHDGAAAGLADRLTAQGFTVDRQDFLDVLPAGAGRLLCGSYHRLLTWAPEGYQHLYRATDRASRPGLVWRALFRSAERRLLRGLAPDTCAVVSTYPGASQVLGALRLRGRLTVPALTYLTDFSVHALWIAPGIDAHLAVHAVPAAQAHAQGAAGVTVAGPVTDARFTPATDGQRPAARTRFGLPAQAPLALLVAGSWGVGPVRRAAAEIRATGLAVPVVVCGRNTALVEELKQDGIAFAFGWVDDMPGLMHACDVLVQNAGGLTSLEAFAAGLPVASYRCIPGHGRTNAEALEEAGLAAWIRGPEDLAPVLADLLHGARGSDQRAAGIALHRSAPGPVPAVAARTGHRPDGTPPSQGPGGPRWRRQNRRRGRARVVAAVAAVVATLTLGIAAPLADAFGHAPGGIIAVTHYLDGDRS
ncbi:UDP-N-acetylglucosamine:LPS N-acetylglucosamine transferase [Actinacidiphila rubida]|uniref:UDP-N-acetylglucosamine:LPS N-acetylglucosamine transferase n=2 Tax=Actinacidiphila rubida TaxID=310780 RepID=A0A1H8G4S9_9ACTN|nr:glycosyltransferase [Actinacidiphila rubida]SEN38765.1 UDP-N-acetylglucosamine:LPS N-acetylglucosamine transferase [Actinacidiphila rubida]